MPRRGARPARTAFVGAVCAVGLLVSTVAAGAGPERRADEPTINYAVAATRPKRICVGSEGTVSVWVERRVSAPDASPRLLNAGLLSVERDVVIEATIADPSIISTEEPAQITGIDGSRPPTATFTFHARKQGVTTVTFTARIVAMGETDGWKGALADKTLTVEVRVTNCRFEVSVASVWRVEGEATLAVGAGILRVELAPSDDGEYRTLGHATWSFSAESVGDCSGTLTADGTTDVPIFATMDQSGRLFLDVRYDPVVVKIYDDCKETDGTMSMDLQAATLTFDVPSTGGQNRLDHDLSGTRGKAIYVVEPLDVQEL